MTGINDTKYDWYKLLNVPRKCIYRDDRESTEYNRICEENLSESIKAYIIKMIVIIISFFGAAIGPFYSNIHDGTFATLYSLKLPYFNQDLYTEFVINVIWQFIVTVMGVSALFLMEGCFSILNDTITVSLKLFRLNLNLLSQCLENELGMNAKSQQKLKTIFMKISYMDE